MSEISEGGGALCYVRRFGVRTKNPIGSTVYECFSFSQPILLLYCCLFLWVLNFAKMERAYSAGLNFRDLAEKIF